MKDASDWAVQQDLPPGPKAVLYWLSYYAWEDGQCRAKQSTIAKWTGYSVRSIRRYLKALEDDHRLIHSTKRWRRDGSQDFTRYQLHIENFDAAHRRTGCPPMDDDRRTGCPPTIGGQGVRLLTEETTEETKKEKSRLRRILDNEDLRKWVIDHRPDLDFEELAEAWDDTWTGKGIVPGIDQEAALFKGYARKAPRQKIRKTPRKDTRPAVPHMADGLDAETAKAWQECHRRLAQAVGIEAWHSWLGRCTYDKINDGAALIAAPSALIKDRIKNDHGIAIERELTDHLGHPIHIEFSISKEKAA